MSDEFTMTIRGDQYGGWTDQAITRSIEQLAHSFQVSYTDIWAAGGERIPINEGDDCTIKHGNDLLTTGYVVTSNKQYDAKRRVQSFAGNSKTIDIVDCSPDPSTRKSWRNSSLREIAEALCSPFGISVSIAVNTGANFTKFTIEEGETVFAALERMCRERGALLRTNQYGDLVVDRAGTLRSPTALRHGVNILSGNISRTMRDRFSEYTILCQSTGGDELFGSNTSLKRSSTDDGVPRTRPLTITADTEDSGSELQKRADWERNVRAGRAKRYTYTVVGWEHDSGLWEPNTLVRVVDPEAELDADLLIVTTTHRRGNRGTFTDIVVTGKEAFDVQPLPPKRPKGGVFP